MAPSNVYFIPVTAPKSSYPEEALAVFKMLLEKEQVELGPELPLKIHPGEPGNVSYNKAENYDRIIDFLDEKHVKTYFIETNTVTGRRTNKADHLEAVKEHGFTRIPFVIADGGSMVDDVPVPVRGGKHFKTAKIATLLANKKQVLVLNHFKGHGMAGFGAAIKMLGIGFASRRGKMEIHTIKTPPDDGTINWGDRRNLQPVTPFLERTAEYAAAAAVGKNHLYVTYAINLVSDCDCDGIPLKPLYPDLGIFASKDPLAIDKACFDMLSKRENKKPFEGSEIFEYAQNLGLGTTSYNLVTVQ